MATINSEWSDLQDKAFRDAYAEGLVDNRLSAQIYYLRVQRGWTQKDLAERSGVSQPTISGLEASTEGARLATLRKIASAFDVAVDTRFVSFSTLLRAFRIAPLNVHIPSFSDDAPPQQSALCVVRFVANTAAATSVPTSATQSRAWSLPSMVENGEEIHVQ